MARPNLVRRVWGRVAGSFRALGGMVFQGTGGGGGPGWRLLLPGSQFDYEAAAGDLWRNSAVAACLGWLKKNFPEPTLEVATKEADGSELGTVDHDLVRLLNRPNPYYDRYTFWAAVCLSWVVDGNVYIRKVRSASGKVVQLWWLPHWLVWPRWPMDGSEFISYYQYQVNGRLERIAVEDLVHLRSGIDPHNDRKGLAELKSALRAVFGLNECDSYTAAILKNMGIVGAVISPGSPDVDFMPEDIDDARQLWRERHTGDNRGEPFFATRSVKVERLGLSPEELRLDKLPARLEDQVCAAIGVPAMVVGVSSGAQHKTYANYGEARQAAYEDCLIPLQKAIAEGLTHQLLVPDFGGKPHQRVRWNYAGVQCLSENETEVADRVGKQYQTYQTIKRSEARQALGYDYGPEDEVYYSELPAPIDATDDQADGIPLDDESEDERTRAWQRLESVLGTLEAIVSRRRAARSDDRGGTGDGGVGGGPGAQPADTGRGPSGPGPGQQPRAAGGPADRERTPEGVRGAGGEGAGDDPDGGRGAAGGVPVAHGGGVARPDADGHDAPDQWLLGRRGPIDAGPAGPGA